LGREKHLNIRVASRPNCVLSQLSKKGVNACVPEATKGTSFNFLDKKYLGIYLHSLLRLTTSLSTPETVLFCFCIKLWYVTNQVAHELYQKNPVPYPNRKLTKITPGASNNNPSRRNGLPGPWKSLRRSLQTSLRLLPVRQSPSQKQSRASQHIRLPRPHSRRSLQNPKCQTPTRRESEYGRCDGEI
jgi:hypothetical protein